MNTTSLTDTNSQKRAERLLLDKALSMAQSCLEAKIRNRGQPKIIGAGVEANRILLMLDKKVFAPEGFRPLLGGSIWEMEMSFAKKLEFVGSLESNGLMAQVGYYNQADVFYLNLEVTKSIRIVGAHIQIVNYLTELAGDLLVSQVGTGIPSTIFCVGFGYEFPPSKNFKAVERLSDILPIVEKHAQNFSNTKKRSAQKQLLKTYKAKNHIGGENRSPILVLDPFTDNRQLTARLELLSGKGVSSIMGYSRGEATLEVTDTTISFSPLGLMLNKQASNKQASNRFLSGSTSKNISKKDLSVSPKSNTLKSNTLEKQHSGGFINPNKKLNSNSKLNGRTAGYIKALFFDEQKINGCQKIDKNQTISKNQKLNEQNKIPKINLLGPVHIANEVHRTRSLHTLSLICFLATNRSGASADQMMRWLWPPEKPPSRQLLANVISRARRSLGMSHEGTHHITQTNGIYRLEAEIKADFEEFRIFWQLANSQERCQKKIELLKKALSLVKGVPISMGKTHTIQWAENGLRYELECEIDTVAHQLCDLAIEAKDFETARSAVIKGLMCIPGCDECMSRLLLLSAESKNFGSFIKARNQMMRSYEALGYEVPRHLIELFEKLYINVSRNKKNVRL